MWCGGGVVWYNLPIIEPTQSKLFNSGLYWVVAIDYSICDRAAKFYHPLKRDNFTVFLCQVIAEYELDNMHNKLALEEDHWILKMHC